MAAAKPPERVTFCLDANGCIARHGEGTEHIYLLASAVEKRERAYIRLKDWAIANFHEGYDAELDEILAALAATKEEKSG